MGRPAIPLETKFWKYADTSGGPDACWPWTSAHDRRGYGVVNSCGRQYRATHVALRIAGRPLGDGLMACHHCDNPPCVNPAHLFAGTARDNMRDGVAKGRPIGTYERTPEVLARLSAGLRASFAADPRNTRWQRSKTHCPSGHPYDQLNTVINNRGYRRCRACIRARHRCSAS